MKKLIPLLVICLAVLCFFTSCGELEKLFLEGTWRFDYAGGWGNYRTYRVVFSKEQVQIIETLYMDSGHRFVKSSDATEPMPYTVGEDGVVTLSYNVGIMKMIEITDTFTLDEALAKLIWKQGYSEDVLELDKENNETTFSEPSRGYEQYTCEVAEYWEPGEEVLIKNSNLFLYSDGKFSWEGEGKTVSSGRWEKSTSEPNKISLIPSSGWAFTRMDLEYITDSPEASHLKADEIIEDNFEIFTGFSYDFAWYVEAYR